MQPDKIEKLGNSVIQHGPFNRRIYLMKLAEKDLPGIIDKMQNFAKKNQYTKIFCKVPSKFENFFTDKGYKKEAFIPKYLNGLLDLSFVSKFLDKERENNYKKDEIDKIISIAKEKAGTDGKTPPEGKFTIRKAEGKDAPEMAEIYKVVFKTYPFPIHDPEYIKKTMQENISYFLACEGDKIAAASSAEKDEKNHAVEMTDFATLPDYRGNGLAVILLDRMEKEMKNEKYITSYTIARAASAGMNITFSRREYEYSGTLINNTNISGNIESMNIWHKKL